MEKRKRGRGVRGRTKPPFRWDIDDWERGWTMAMRRIDGAPLSIVREDAFHHAVEMLDRGFAEGDFVQFGHGLITLMDCCIEAINQGSCKQWWD